MTDAANRPGGSSTFEVRSSSNLEPRTSNSELQLSPDERAVLAVLVRHRGRQEAVGLEIVAGTAGISERNVQETVVHLIERHGWPIGSAVKPPMGYFLIQTDEELAESLSQLVHRLTALARRIAALKHSTLPIVLNQLALEIEEVRSSKFLVPSSEHLEPGTSNLELPAAEHA